MPKNYVKALPKMVVDALCAWPSLEAALQCGGLEYSAAVPIGGAIEAAVGLDRSLVCVREYKIRNEKNPKRNGRLRIDYAVATVMSVGRPTLKIRDVIEVKFNYAKQICDIKRRLESGMQQAALYKNIVKATNAYLLFVVAAPYSHQLPDKTKSEVDPGWRYWDGKMSVENVLDLAPQIFDHHVKPLAIWQSKVDCSQIICAVFNAAEDKSDTSPYSN